MLDRIALVAALLAAGTTDAGSLVLDDAAPAVPGWTFNAWNDRLLASVDERDGERVLCVSNPIPATVAKGEATRTSWSLVSPSFAVKAGGDVEIALRLMTPAPETGGVPYGVWRTGVAWVDAGGKEIGFRTMSFPRQEGFLRTHVRRYLVPEGAVTAQISLGFNSPDFPRDGQVFALASARARLLEHGAAGAADPRFEETSVPTLHRLTESPCEDTRTTVDLEICAKHPIDWTTFACTVDGVLAPERIRRKGNRLTVLPPAGGWKLPSFPEIGVSGRDVRGTRFVDSQICCFGERMRKGIVSLRDDGMTLVDGKPFFPIGVYGINCTSSKDDELLRDAKALGFNTVTGYIRERAHVEALLTAADRLGLKVFIGTGVNRGPRVPIVQGLNMNDGVDPLENVYGLRHHPSLLAWCIGDDVATHQAARHLRHIHDRVKAVDNAHLTLQSDSILWRDLTLSRYTRCVGATDVFVPQFYPVMKPEITGRETPEIQRDMAVYAEDRRLVGNPPVTGLWPVLQGFCGEGSWKRLPTAAEIRAQTWLSVVCGGRGVVWYTYHLTQRTSSPLKCLGVIDDPAHKKNMTDVIAELNAHMDDLVTRDANVQPTVEVVEGSSKNELGFPAVACLLKVGVGGNLLIAVNTSSKPLKAKIAADGRTFEESFKPLGVRFYKIH